MIRTDQPPRTNSPGLRRKFGRRPLALLAAAALSTGLVTASMTAVDAASPTNAAVAIVNPTAGRPRDVLVTATNVYWPNLATGTIQRSDLNGNNVVTLYSNLDGPSGLATDGTYIYWTNGQAGPPLGSTIGRALLDGTTVNPDNSFITGAQTPIGLAVSGNFIYWTNYAGNGIGRATLNGAGAATGISQTYIPTPLYSYGLDVNGSNLYWATYLNFSSNTISKADISVAFPPVTTFNTGATGPVGVTSDSTYLYWSNFGNGTIGRARLDGTGTPTQTYVTGLTDVVGMAVNSSALYFTSTPDVGISKILRAEFDVTAPVITVPANISVTATAVPMTITYPTAISAADPDDAVIVPVCTPGNLTGGSFDQGVTTVTCTAKDDAGNLAVSKTFTVSVSLPNAPVITVPADITTPATSTAGAVVNYPAPTATPSTPVTCSKASGSVFAIGPTNVICSANDGLNPVVTKSFTVTVTDPGGPAINIPVDISATATSPAGAAVSYPTVTASEGTPTCDYASGAVFPIGQTTITCTVAGTFGTSKGTFHITVVKPGVPVVKPPANVAVDSAIDEPIAVTFGTPTSAAGTPTCTPASGSKFPVGITIVKCSITDAYGQTGSANFTVTVNRIASFIPIVPVNPNPGGVTPGTPAPNANGPVAVAPATTAAPTTAAPTTAAPTTAAPTTTKAPVTTAAPTTTAPAAAPTAAPADTAAVATPVPGDPNFTG
jgi:HYR domain